MSRVIFSCMKPFDQIIALIEALASSTFSPSLLIFLDAVSSGINLKSFHHCTKQRNSTIFVAKYGVAMGASKINWI